MDALNYESAKSLPLYTGEQILERVANLVGTAIGTKLWLLLLDGERIQLQQVLEIERDTVAIPEERRHGLLRLAESLVASGARSVVAVLERPGAERFTQADLAWASVLSSAFCSSDLQLAGMVVSHSKGVRWLAEDDYLPREEQWVSEI